MLMSAEIEQQVEVTEWLDAPLDAVNPPHPELKAWLTFDGLLSVKLKLACGERFRLQVLDSATGPGLMTAERRIRRVILSCGDIACIYAESHIPLKALALVPKLRSLGNEPLGETLQSQTEARRGPFSYALLNSPNLPIQLGGIVDGPLWARRSSFYLAGSSLTVSEIFLPGILGRS